MEIYKPGQCLLCKVLSTSVVLSLLAYIQSETCVLFMSLEGLSFSLVLASTRLTFTECDYVSTPVCLSVCCLLAGLHKKTTYQSFMKFC